MSEKRRGRPAIPHQSIDGVEKKYCRGCQAWKSLDQFMRRSVCWDGLKSRCASCSPSYIPGSKTNATRLERGYSHRIRPGQRYGRVIVMPSGQKKRVRLYVIWESMIQRCHYPKQKSYYRYGGRGISVCAVWRGSYDEFRAWAVSHGYSKRLTLDRINPRGNYEPANCRWLPASEQQWNTRATKHITLNGVTRPLPVWSRLLGLSMESLRVRLRNGWPHEHVLTVPPGGRCPGFPYQKPGRKAQCSSSKDSSNA